MDSSFEMARPAEILLVDDSEADILLTRAALKSAKIANQIHVAHDGEQAWRMLRGETPNHEPLRPDLVLLDVNLPRMDGRELLAHIKAAPELSGIPVAMMTGSEAETDFIKSRNGAGATHYIVKPLDPAQLMSLVSSIDNLWLRLVCEEGASK